MSPSWVLPYAARNMYFAAPGSEAHGDLLFRKLKITRQSVFQAL